MRCIACDTLLNDDELQLKDALSGHPLDMCTECIDASAATEDDEGCFDYLIEPGGEL